MDLIPAISNGVISIGIYIFLKLLSENFLDKLTNCLYCDCAAWRPIPFFSSQQNECTDIPVELRSHVVSLSVEKNEVVSRPVFNFTGLHEKLNIIGIRQRLLDIMVDTLVWMLNVDFGPLIVRLDFFTFLLLQPVRIVELNIALVG